MSNVQSVVVLILTLSLAAIPSARSQVIVDEDVSQARMQWQKHILETKRRVQENAERLRREPRLPATSQPSQQEAARRASESALDDHTLAPGDIVVTDKGGVIFRGWTSDEARRFDRLQELPAKQ